MVSNLNIITGCTFNSNGTGHAVDLGTISANQTLNWDNNDTDYAAANGATGNETILVSVDSGVTLTINVSDTGTVPTYYNTGLGTVNVVAGQKTFTFTLSPAITGYEWRIYSVTAVGSLIGSTELAGEEVATLSSQSYTYTYTVDTIIAVQILGVNYVDKPTYYTLKNASQSVSVILTEDNNN